MTARPILFTGDMVRAILDGRKTQTRRPVKPQPDKTWEDGRPWWNIGGLGGTPSCPYGLPGDLLWVRETWAHYQTVNHRRCPDGRSFDEVSDGLAGYRADGHNTIEDFRNHIRLMSGCDLEAVLINGDRWRHSIHMPRWACRLVLEVVSVRVERVQEITEDGAKAEGVRRMHEDDLGQTWKTYRRGFQSAWDSIYAAKGRGWDANPWVWAVEFKAAAKTLNESRAILEGA